MNLVHKLISQHHFFFLDFLQVLPSGFTLLFWSSVAQHGGSVEEDQCPDPPLILHSAQYNITVKVVSQLEKVSNFHL